MSRSPDVRLLDVDAIATAVVRARVEPGGLSAFVPASCGDVWTYFRAHGLPKPGRNMALYLPGGMVEAGAEVAAPFTGDEHVIASQLPAGRVGTATHLGLYSGLARAHAHVREWCAAHGHALSGVCWEIHGHWEPEWNTDPTRIRTDLFHLLAD